MAAGGNLIIYSEDEDEDNNDKKTNSDQVKDTGKKGTSHGKKQKSVKMEKYVFKDDKARKLIAFFREEIDALNKEGKCSIEIQEKISQVILQCKGEQTLLAKKKEELDKFIGGLQQNYIATTLEDEKEFIEDFLKRELSTPPTYTYNESGGQYEFIFFGNSASELKNLKDQLESKLKTLYENKHTKHEVESRRRKDRFTGTNSADHKSDEEKSISDESVDQNDDEVDDDDYDDDDSNSSFEKVDPSECMASSDDDHFVRIDLRGKGIVIFEFNLKGNPCVQLIRGSITDVKCDAIVNAANENIRNIGGVALAISQAAGRQFEKKCQEKIEKKKKINVTKNVVTESGDLNCGFVIHAVGPNWGRYSNSESCFRDLLLTVENILKTAEKRNFKTVVMPPISSGIFGVPKKGCAAMYVNALMKYADTRRSNVIKKFGIIDINDTILDLVKEAYEEWFKDPSQVDPKVVARKHSHSSQGGSSHGQYGGARHKTNITKGNYRDDSSWITPQKKTTCREMQTGCYKLGEKLDIYIRTGDIVSLALDVLVIAEDRRLSGQGILTKKVKTRGGQKYVKERERKLNECLAKIGDVVATTAGDLKFSLVFHAIIEKFMPTKMPDEHDLSVLYNTTKNILDKVEKGTRKKSKKYKDIYSVAMPLFGTGSIENSHFLEKYCETVFQALCDYVDQGHVSLSEIHLVNFKDCTTDSFLKVFSRNVQVKPKDKAKQEKTKQYSVNQDKKHDIQVKNKDKAKQEKTNQYSAKQDKKQDYHSGGQNRVSSATPSAIRMFNTFQPEKYTKIDEWNFHPKDTNVDVEKYLEPVPNITKKKGNLHIMFSESDDDESSSAGQPEDANSDNSECVICMSEMDDAVQLTACHHRFCRDCISTQFSHKPICPVCGKTYDERYGNQPSDGYAKVYEDDSSLPGFKKCGTAIIDYHFNDGQQSVSVHKIIC